MANLLRTITAGFAGGITFIVMSIVTFVLIGGDFLSDPTMQSRKVLLVFNELEPLPLFATAPYVIFSGYIFFSIGHAFLFRSVAAAWPLGVRARTWRLALITWGLSCVFFEFLGPFNLLGEPMTLVVLELSFWALCALVESVVIISVLERKQKA